MFDKEIGLLIKNKRIDKNMKQLELAEKLGISRTYLSDIENSRYLPSSKLLFKINNELKLFILRKNDGKTMQKGE